MIDSLELELLSETIGLGWIENFDYPEIKSPPVVERSYDGKLYGFQEVGVERLSSQDRLFLADDMGTGKTVQAVCGCLRVGAKKVLVVCPNTMKGISKDGQYLGGWAEEIHKWAPESTIAIVNGSPKKRMDAIFVNATFTIVNYEALIGKTGATLMDELTKVEWDVLIFDEHHRIKNRKAQVTKSARKVAARAKRVWMLSGTPILNHASEIWAPLNIMFPQDHRWSSFWRFANEYCDTYKGQYGWVVDDIQDPNAPQVQALRLELMALMLRRTKAEVLKDMPTKTIKQVWVDLHGKQLAAYLEMERDMLAHLDDRLITAAAVIAQIIRLKQITVGAELMFHDRSDISGAKVDALNEIIEAVNGKPLVVFSQFRTALERLQPLLSKPSELFTGAVPQIRRTDAVAAFQRGEIPILLATTQAGGQGLTLTAASTAVFLDKMWTPAMNVQAQDRLHRIGQTEPVTIIELLASRSVEEKIERMLARKTSTFINVIEQPGVIPMPVSKMTGAELLRQLYQENEDV